MPFLNNVEQVVANVSGKVRYDTMGGDNYMVVPMTMIVEGVHNGTKGPLYYPQDELEKGALMCNHKPIVVYHPERNGAGISACSPDVINSRGIGMVMNTICTKVKIKIKKKGVTDNASEEIELPAWKAEAWLKTNRVKEVDARIMNAIEHNKITEVSTGLFTDNEDKDGEWNGESYKAIARNLRLDHLAVLPDVKGACSIADGAGLLRNEKSHDDVRRALSDLISKPNKIGTGAINPCYIESVYNSFFVYNENGKLYKRDYFTSGEQVELGKDKPLEVFRKTIYETAEGDVVGNSQRQWVKVNGVWCSTGNADKEESVGWIKVKGKQIFRKNKS